ncbi:MAG TPA: LysM peptidoglycan-binding domain-containing protein [Gammaproteobacteria bacterium]|jgi:outer membrane protein|nr:LysM peptidoglycan-binding domain-containing protein [Gammaproteobacteria bacterium]
MSGPPQHLPSNLKIYGGFKTNMIKAFLYTVVILMASGSTWVSAQNQYTVQPGDTPCEIAELFGVRCADLMAWNGLDESGVIYPGQSLKITSAPAVESDEEESQTQAATVTTGVSATTDNENPAQTDTDTARDSATTVIVSSSESTTSGIDLLAIYRLAWSSDPEFATQVHRREAGQEAIPQALAAFRPHLSASSSYTLVSRDLTNQAASATVSLKQSIYDRSSRLLIKQARLQTDAADVNYQIAAESLIQRVANSYFAVLSAQDNLELSERNQRAIRRQLELAEERLDVGLGTRTDLYDARARYEYSVAEGIEAQRVLVDMRQVLVALVGRDPGTLLSLSPAAALSKPQPDDAGLWIGRALLDNRSLKALSLDTLSAETEIDRQQALRRLTVGLNLSAEYSDSASADGTDASLTLLFKLPFYQGGLINAQIREATSNHNAARARYESARREIQRKTRQAFLSINSQLRRITALAQAVTAGESALQAKEEGFAAGLTTNIEVLNAQRDLFRAERDYLKARYDYVLQVLVLEQLAGQLNEEDVSRVNRWLG